MGNVFRYARIGPRLIALFLLPLVAYGAYSVGDRWYQNYVLTYQAEAIRVDVMRLRNENLRLQAELAEARSEAGIEKIARGQLGLIRPGDVAVQIVSQASAAPAPSEPGPNEAPAAAVVAPAKPAWLLFLDGIFGR